MLSDCAKCWDTPCECGYNYRNWSKDRLENFIKILEDVKTGKLRWNLDERIRGLIKRKNS